MKKEEVLYKVNQYSDNIYKCWVASQYVDNNKRSVYNVRYTEDGPIHYNQSSGYKWSDQFFNSIEEARLFIKERNEYRLIEVCKFTYDRVRKSSAKWGVFKFIYYCTLYPWLKEKIDFYLFSAAIIPNKQFKKLKDNLYRNTKT